MDYLSYDEFVPYAPSKAGETTNIHHCKTGRNNDRLYITRKEDGITIVAYCHHCGRRGISKLDGPRNISHFRKTGDRLGKNNKSLTLPWDFDKEFNKWPQPARAWILKYGITEEEVRGNNLGFSKYFGRVVLPTFSTSGTLVQYQTRRIDGISPTVARESTRKYETYARKDLSHFERLFVPRNNRHSLLGSTPVSLHSVCCIVEDTLSAIKCNRIIDTIALNGTNLDLDSILLLNKYYNNYIIYLDNDNNQVKKTQTRLKKRIDLTCKGVCNIVYEDRDPKELSMRELKEVLKI